MRAGKLKIPLGKIVKENLTLEVEMKATGVRWLKFRMWLGARIMRVAAWVIGCNISIGVSQ